MSDEVKVTEEVKITEEQSVKPQESPLIDQQDVDENVYKRGQQHKWTRARKGDQRDDDSKRPKKWEREHKVQ